MSCLGLAGHLGIRLGNMLGIKKFELFKFLNNLRPPKESPVGRTPVSNFK